MSPCWQLIQESVDLGQCDRETLIEALAEMGAKPVQSGSTITFTTEYGVAQIVGDQVIMRGSGAVNAETVGNKVKRAVMGKSIEKGAARFGWKVEKVKGTNKIKLKRQ